MVTRAIPILKMRGGKTQLLSVLDDVLPACRLYVDPFVGGGAVPLAFWARWGKMRLSDLREENVAVLKAARDGTLRLPEAYDWSEIGYYLLRDKQEYTPRDWVILNRLAFNGVIRASSRSRYNVPYGKPERMPALPSPRQLAAVRLALQGARLRHQGFREALDRRFGDGTCIYLDPPYLGTAADYCWPPFDADDHAELADLARHHARQHRVVISNSLEAVSLYSKHFTIYEVSGRTSVSQTAGGRGERREMLAVNEI